MRQPVGSALLRSRRGSPCVISSAADRATAPYSRSIGPPADRTRVTTSRPFLLTSVTAGSRARWWFSRAISRAGGVPAAAQATSPRRSASRKARSPAGSPAAFLRSRRATTPAASPQDATSTRLPSKSRTRPSGTITVFRRSTTSRPPRKKKSNGNITCNISFYWLQSSELLSTGGHSPMATFTQYTIANAPEASQPLLEQVDKALGFIPNLYATFAESPALLQGALALDAGLDQGALSGVERQLVKIAVSTENGCTYCVAAHSTIAGMLKARPEVVNAVRTGVPVSDAKIDALVRFTRAVVRNKGFVQDGETAAFLAAGYKIGRASCRERV